MCVDFLLIFFFIFSQKKKNIFCPFLFPFQLLVVNKRFYFLLLYLLNVLFIYCCPNFFDDNTGNLSADWRLAGKCYRIFFTLFFIWSNESKKGRTFLDIFFFDVMMRIWKIIWHWLLCIYYLMLYFYTKSLNVPTIKCRQ